MTSPSVTFLFSLFMIFPPTLQPLADHFAKRYPEVTKYVSVFDKEYAPVLPPKVVWTALFVFL